MFIAASLSWSVSENPGDKNPAGIAWIHLVDLDKQLACHAKKEYRINDLQKPGWTGKAQV
jgi:hypothetical protein